MQNMLNTKTLLIGKNKYENNELFDNADYDDIWFHMKDVPSAHLWVKSCILTKNEIYLIALQLKKNSKHKKENNISVVYTKKHNLQKTATLGTLTIIGKSQCVKV